MGKLHYICNNKPKECTYMSYTPFNPKSKRAIAGLNFQQKVFDQFQKSFPNIGFEMTWDFYKNQNPSLTNKELAILEKRDGDITYVFEGQRHYVECCFAMGEKLSRLCEMKRLNFIGKNKWYCYGFANSEDIVFMPSTVWKKYTSKIDKADKSCRMVPLANIKNLKAGRYGVRNYWNYVHSNSRKI